MADEEQAQFWATEIRESYLKLVASSSAMFMRIEDLLMEIEDLERFAYEGHYISKAKALKGRLTTLQLRFTEASNRSQLVVDRALQNLNYLLISLTSYRKGLNKHGIGDVEERDLSKAVALHPVALGKRARARAREESRDKLRKERTLRTTRSYNARKAVEEGE